MDKVSGGFKPGWLFNRLAYLPIGFLSGAEIPGGFFPRDICLVADFLEAFCLGGLFPGVVFFGWLYVWLAYFQVAFFPGGFCRVTYFLDPPRW